MTFTIPDMSCGHCTAAIEAAIKAKDPAATIQCNLAAHTVSVQSALSDAVIAATLAGAGYPAT